MSFHHVLTELFYLVPIILQGAIVPVMVRRQLAKIFPFFFIYTIGILCTEIPLVFLPYNHNAYALVYWSGESVAIVLGFAVIFEVLRHILPSSPAGRSILNVVWVLAVVAVIVAVMMLVWSKPGMEGSWLEVVGLIESSLRFLQVSLLMTAMTFMSLLGLTWQHESFGILLGFGVYAAVALVAFEFGLHLHLMSSNAGALLDSIGYSVAILIWAFYILRPCQRPPAEQIEKAGFGEWINKLNDDVDQWSQRY